MIFAAASSMLMTVVVLAVVAMLVAVTATSSVLMAAMFVTVAMHFGCRSMGLGVPSWFSAARSAHGRVRVERGKMSMYKQIYMFWSGGQMGWA